MYICMYVGMYVYSTVVLVPGDPLRSYIGHANWLRPLYIICPFVKLNSVCCRPLPYDGFSWNSNVQPSNVTCILVAVYETPTLECDRVDSLKVCII